MRIRSRPCQHRDGEADVGGQRALLLGAAGTDGELDADEHAAAAKQGGSFVRAFDKLSAMPAFDRDRNGKISWAEADAYRRALLPAPGRGARRRARGGARRRKRPTVVVCQPSWGVCLVVPAVVADRRKRPSRSVRRGTRAPLPAAT